MPHFRFQTFLLAAIATLPAGAFADTSGTVTVSASFALSLDTGVLGGSAPDIMWSLTTPTIRSIAAQGTARLINLGNLGAGGFAALTSGALTQLVYTGAGINGNNDNTNVLVTGDVFAVFTNGGNYSKVLVTGYSTNAQNATAQDIHVQYVTYTQAFAHIVMGPLGTDVWTTAFILNNTTSSPAPFMINFLQDSGLPLQLGSSGVYDLTHQANVFTSQNGQYASGTIQPRNNITIVLSSTTAFFQGSATINAPGVTAQAVFHRHTAGGADYEATVPESTGGTEYIVPYDATFFFNGTSSVTALPYITGMALANLDPVNSATITCSIYDQNAVNTGISPAITIPPSGHFALQLTSATGFSSVAGNIGSLDCSSTGTSFAVLGLRFLGTNDFTSFAAIRVH